MKREQKPAMGQWPAQKKTHKKPNLLQPLSVARVMKHCAAPVGAFELMQECTLEAGRGRCEP